MAVPLSMDLRKRLVRAVEQGSSAREAARRFDVSPSAAIKLVSRVRRTGSPAPAKIGGCRRPLLDGHEALLRELTTAKPGITLSEIQAALTQRGIAAGSLTTIWSTLRRLGLSHKKRMARPVCKGEVGWRAGLHQRIRSQGRSPGQDGMRALQAS